MTYDNILHHHLASTPLSTQVLSLLCSLSIVMGSYVVVATPGTVVLCYLFLNHDLFEGIIVDHLRTTTTPERHLMTWSHDSSNKNSFLIQRTWLQHDYFFVGLQQVSTSRLPACTNERQVSSSLRLKQVSNIREQPRDTIETRDLSIIACGGLPCCCSQRFALLWHLHSLSLYLPLVKGVYKYQNNIKMME